MIPNDKRTPPHQAFMNQKHATFNTSEEVIQSIVKKATGSVIKTKEKIAKGEVNEVYIIKTESEQEIVIRISRAKHPKFEGEKWAIETCTKIGIPAPKVLLLDSITVDGKTLAVCVESKLPGTPLDELKKIIPESEYVSLLKKSGKMLSQINAIKINGFGLLDKNGNGKYGSIKEILLGKYVTDQEALLVAAESASLDPVIVIRALEILKRESENFPPTESRLLHNDWGTKHILVSDNEITGIIDFEVAQGGDPVREFARWDFYYPSTPWEYLKEEYEDTALFSDDFEKRFWVWKLFLGLSSLRYYVDEKNLIGLEKTVKKLTETVDYFQ